MKLICLLLATTTWFAHADEKIKMSFKDAELSKVIETYSKAYNQKFMISPEVRGRITIYSNEPLSKEEAFNQLSAALALNGFGISKRDDTMVVRAVRNTQKDLIEVGTERPSLKPERMYTWVYTLKNISPKTAMEDLRFMASKDGEMSMRSDAKQIIFTDWTSNLNRIAELMNQLDKKTTK